LTYLISHKINDQLIQDQEKIYLGGWCLNEIPSVTDFCYKNIKIAAPYGHIQKERSHAEYLLLTYYPVYIKEIARVLNQYHSVAYSERYWEILIGPWLNRFIQLILNRYLHLKKIFNDHPDIKRHYISSDKIKYLDLVGLTEIESVELIKSEYWNNILYGLVIKLFFPKIENVFTYAEKEKDKQKKISIKRRLFGWIENKRIKKIDYPFFIYKTYLSAFSELRLLLTLKLFPVRWGVISFKSKIKYSEEARRKISKDLNIKLEYSQVINAILPYLVPNIYLENYKDGVEASKKNNWPKNPRVIYTAQGFAYDPIFQFWVAYQTEENHVKYIIGQHGNNYGTLVASVNFPEMRTPNEFLTWGWGSSKNYVCKIKPHYYLLDRRLKASSKKTFLIMMKGPGNRSSLACRYFEYVKEISRVKKVIAILCSNTDWKIILRLHIGVDDLAYKELHTYCLLNNFNIIFDKGHHSISSYYGDVGCFVYTYDSTGILESLSANIPTLAIFDNWDGRLFPDAESDYESLRSVGILHYSTDEFSSKIKEIGGNIFTWWEREAREKAIKFTAKYINKSYSAINCLKFLKTSN
jgi:putative transferase (TIGR04331 family)